MHIISYATTAQSPFQMVVKSNIVSLRHNHSPETLIIHITQCIHNHFAFKILFSTKFYFQKILFLKILFFEICIKIYLILFEFNKFFFSKKILFYNEQCSFGDSGKKMSQNRSKMGRVHRVHCQRPAQAPRPRAPRAPSTCLPHVPRAPSACLPRAQRPAAHLRLRLAAARPCGRAPASARAPAACAPQHARPARPSTPCAPRPLTPACRARLARLARTLA